MENKVLGKGLSALLTSTSEDAVNEAVKDSSSSTLSITKIKNNHLQPRINYDEDKLNELVESIKEKGILQPILVREYEGAYEVIAGERRLRAARQLGLKEVPVVIKPVSDREALIIALVENIQREDLNPIEEARGYKKLMEEFQLNHDDLAASVGKDRSTVANVIRLLKLPENVQTAVFEKKISSGHARALLGLENARQQEFLCKQIMAKNLSVREVERLVKLAREDESIPQAGAKIQDQNVILVEEKLQRAFGTKVKLQANKNKGKIIIEYYSLDDLDRIIEKVC